MRNIVSFFICAIIINIFSIKLFAENTNKISDKNQKNIIAFAEVYGFARYYYPRKKMSNELWEKLVVKGLHMTYNCQNTEELIDSLNAYLSLAAPEILITKKPLTDTLNSKEMLKKRFYQEHRGFGEGDLYINNFFLKILINKSQPYKTKIIKEKPINNTMYFNFGIEDFYLNIPYSLKKKQHKIVLKSFVNNDYYHQIGIVIISWNIFKHFYPYQEEIKSSWEKSLTESLKMISNENLEYTTQDALKHLTYYISDGHARVFVLSEIENSYPPFNTRLINDKLYVNEIKNDLNSDLKTGMEILSIDDKKASYICDSLDKLISYSTKKWRGERIEEEILKGDKGSDIKVEYINQKGEVKFEKLIRDKKNNQHLNTRQRGVKLLEDSIYFVNIETIDYKNFTKEIPRINNSKGLIIEYGYPYRSGKILSHFKNKASEFPSLYVSSKCLRNFDDDNFVEVGKESKTILPSKDTLIIPVVILTKNNTLSGAETSLDAIKHFKLATIIGKPTGGANGNITGFYLMNKKYYIVFTGMKVINNNGELATKGIQPDIYVPITSEGLKNNKDEILDAAIEYIKNLDK